MVGAVKQPPSVSIGRYTILFIQPQHFHTFLRHQRMTCVISMAVTVTLFSSAAVTVASKLVKLRQHTQWVPAINLWTV